MPFLSTLLTPAPYHILAYGTLLGTTVFQTFIGGTVAFKVLPKPQFSLLQSRIFPLYFTLQTVLPLAAIATHPALTTSPLNVTSLPGLIPLGIAAVSGALNWAWIGPVCTGIKKDWARLEKELESDDLKGDERKAEMEKKRKQFMKWHGVSASVNLAELLALVGYGVVLAEGLRF